MAAEGITKFLAKCVPGVVLGGLVGGAVFGFSSHFQVPDAVSPLLRFEPEAFDMDPTCAKNFLALQAYRDAAPKEFDEAGSHADSLFCFEKQLAMNVVEWDYGDVFVVRRYVRQVFAHLDAFFDELMSKYYTQRHNHYLAVEQDPNAAMTRRVALQQVEDGKDIVRQARQHILEIKECLLFHQTKLSRHLPSLSVPPEAKKTNKRSKKRHNEQKQ